MNKLSCRSGQLAGIDSWRFKGKDTAEESGLRLACVCDMWSNGMRCSNPHAQMRAGRSRVGGDRGKGGFSAGLCYQSPLSALEFLAAMTFLLHRAGLSLALPSDSTPSPPYFPALFLPDARCCLFLSLNTLNYLQFFV